MLPLLPPTGRPASLASEDAVPGLQAGTLALLAPRLRGRSTVADLRDLPSAVLDNLSAPEWRGLLRPDDAPGHPTRIALGSCRSGTVNRLLSAMPQLRGCSIEALSQADGPIDLSRAPGLRCFETPGRVPSLINDRYVPVLVRPPGAPPSFLLEPGNASAPRPELACVEGLRGALGNDAWQLRLIPEAEMARRMTDALTLTAPAYARIGSHDPFYQVDAECLLALLHLVPDVLLPAPAATMVRRWEHRLSTPAQRRRLTRQDLTQLHRLAFDIDDVVRPQRADGTRRARSSRDLTTLALLTQWAWPDTGAYLQAQRIPETQRLRQEVVATLRPIWERRGGGRNASSLLVPSGQYPDEALLARMGLPPRWPPRRLPRHPALDLGDFAGPVSVV